MAASDEEVAYKKLSEKEVKARLKDLAAKSAQFDKTICQFPTQDNRIKNIYKRNTKLENARYLVECADRTRILVHKDVFEFMNEFIRHKQLHGSPLEKVVYEGMTPSKLAVRLISKRPLYFFGRHDSSLLRNGTTPPSRSWLSLGTAEGDEDSIDLCEYISYDEMQLSALCGVSSPTVFINSGSRHNQGIASDTDDYEERGVYVGLVGARFEKTDRMESTHIVVAKRNNEEAGYGKNGNASERRKYLAMWAKLYGLGGKDPHFPSYEEVQSKSTVGTFCPLKRLGAHFNVKVFKRRMRFVIEPYLLDANQRGKEAKKKVYCFAVGLGLGVWAIDSRTQGKYLVDVFVEVIREQDLSTISVVDFSWFPDCCENQPGIKNGKILPTENGNEIEILFTKRNPADKLTGKYAGMLPVSCYAWDGNSFPGNEYWCGMLCASGDPAAASCSTIPEMQNAQINDTLTKESAVTCYPK
uniref:Uncharacterized protein n=1 Tax=Paramoeba aestuarina TaxID=180227 RepID=A0A7S4PK94_9EUKA|mmetsp:Transcript_7938/g.11998  ORF Transcript_7938/g.11998 Transcript_7938/m.11998 type:complete len:470 (+) Transcript_7938:247-1656(+)|eukprot:CAMPEP_0201517532 /NCGR_PEP_ID=MMETSP0161_2-20130828/8613_1 /ASSEMBLY_ACC=CAM_ASM_000251 /TAXON_ID=180227 /ORGANISM="Neoparamoeba aestuarina, Strain SoJaBio B1-5/56/2" /LENGTH=469 /DNA_ID=CAMNT_0047915061 /DNA_START=221 /DNA_END=1630 /DNA_ORIENTATION=+